MITVIKPEAITKGDVQQVTADLTKFDKAKEQVAVTVNELNKFLVISNKEQLDSAMLTLKQALEISKALETKRTELVKPFNDSVKKINTYAKDLTSKISDAIDNIKKACLLWQQGEEKKAAEERKRQRIDQLLSINMCYDEKNQSFELEGVFLHTANLEVAGEVWDRIFKDTVERIAKQNELKLSQLNEEKELVEVFGSDEDKMAIDEKIYNTTKKVAPINISVPANSYSVTKLNGAAKVWKFKVTNPSLVPREYLIVDDTLIRKAVANGSRNIPGVKIFQEDTLRIR